jgi:hypothetical protein
MALTVDVRVLLGEFVPANAMGLAMRGAMLLPSDIDQMGRIRASPFFAGVVQFANDRADEVLVDGAMNKHAARLMFPASEATIAILCSVPYPD